MRSFGYLGFALQDWTWPRLIVLATSRRGLRTSCEASSGSVMMSPLFNAPVPRARHPYGAPMPHIREEPERRQVFPLFRAHADPCVCEVPEAWSLSVAAKKARKARKKSANPVAARAARGNARAFTVVLEELNGKFDVFGEALTGLREHMDRRFEQVDRRFDQMDRRFDALEGRVERVEGCAERVEGRLGRVEDRLGRVESDLSLVKSGVLENAREPKDVRQGVARLEEKLDKKVDRAEIVESALRAAH